MSYIISLLLTFSSNGFTEKSYNNKLCILESRCNQYAVNQFGYLGLYQFGHSALSDIGFKTLDGKWVGRLGVNSPKQFLANLEAQEVAIKEWNEIIDKRLVKCGAYSKIGTKFNKVKLNKYNLRAGSHLLGASYMCKLISGKERVKSDGNGTSVMKYLKEFE